MYISLKCEVYLPWVCQYFRQRLVYATAGWSMISIDNIVVPEITVLSTTKLVLLPGLKWALFLSWSHSLSGDGKFSYIYDSSFSIAVSEFKHTVPFTLHSAHHRVCCMMLHFSSHSGGGR